MGFATTTGGMRFESSNTCGFVRFVLAAGALPSELGPALAEFLPKPPQPPVRYCPHSAGGAQLVEASEQELDEVEVDDDQLLV